MEDRLSDNRVPGSDGGGPLANGRAPQIPYQRSPDWPLAIGWFCLGLYVILRKHYLLLGVGDLGISVAYAVDNVLVKTRPVKWRANAVRVLAAVLFLATLFSLFTPGR